MKKIKFDYVSVNILKGEQNAAEHLVRNPLHQVPALEIDGHVLVQSLPILEYLDETRNYAPYIFPREPHLRAQARAIAEMVNSYVQPLQNLPVLKRVSDIAGEQQRQEWAQHFIIDAFDGIETVLKQSAGEFSVGNELSVADICLVPQFYNAYRFQVSTPDKRWPTVSRVVRHCLEQEVFRQAHPAMQPDTPEDQRGQFAPI